MSLVVDMSVVRIDDTAHNPAVLQPYQPRQDVWSSLPTPNNNWPLGCS